MPATDRVRLAELMATLSMATEAGTTGAVAELGLRTAIFAAHLAREVGADAHDSFYLSLLQYVGCTGDSDVAAAVMGDEVAFGGTHKGIDFGDPMVALPALLGYARRGKSIGAQIGAVVSTLLALPKMAGMTRTHCEVARSLAERLRR